MCICLLLCLYAYAYIYIHIRHLAQDRAIARTVPIDINSSDLLKRIPWANVVQRNRVIRTGGREGTFSCAKRLTMLFNMLCYLHLTSCAMIHYSDCHLIYPGPIQLGHSENLTIGSGKTCKLVKHTHTKSNHRLPMPNFRLAIGLYVP